MKRLLVCLLATTALLIDAAWAPLAAQDTADSLSAQTPAWTDLLPRRAPHLVHTLTMDFRPAALLPTNSFLSGDNPQRKALNKAFSAHLKYGFRFSPHSRFGALYPHATQGIGIAYNTFFSSRMLGNPVALYVFQTSRIARLSSTLSLDYEWNFGASFGWKKYEEDAETENNIIVGSHTNAYLNLGIFLNWQFAPQWNLTAGIDGTHFSNGNTHYPNAGVNTLGVRIGVVRTFGSEEAQPASSEKTLASIAPFRPYVSYDLLLYGAAKAKVDAELNGGYVFPGSFGVVGVAFSPMYSFNRLWRAGLTLDARWDESANVQHHLAGYDSQGECKFYRPPFREQFSVGVSACGELVMPFFAINAGIGYNVVQRGTDTRGFYQTLALKVSLTRRMFLNVGYRLLRFSDPDNLMLGVGYRFGGR